MPEESIADIPVEDWMATWLKVCADAETAAIQAVSSNADRRTRERRKNERLIAFHRGKRVAYALIKTNLQARKKPPGGGC